MSKPILVDLFCGGGGATKGYQRAGFYVIGVDIEPQPDYCGDEFAQADALEVLADSAFMARAAAIHASPPCQARTTMSNRWRDTGGRADQHVNLIPAVLAVLENERRPWIVENVPGARIDLPNAFILTGGMFGLGTHRPRLFGSNMLVMLPPRTRPPQDGIGVYGEAHDGRRLFTRTDGSILRAARSLAEGGAAMGIDWMTWDALREAIPPAYTEWIGHQLPEQMEAVAS